MAQFSRKTKTDSNIRQSVALPTSLPFDFQPRTRLIFGANTVDRIGQLSRELGARRVLLVTDSGIVAAGHAGRVRANLEAEKLKVTVYDKARENPTTLDVDECVQTARRDRIDFFVGLGGGSSMDTAKGCNFIYTNGGRMHDYWGVGKAKKAMLPLIAIPTTAGTGSECQSAALISDATTHQKMACLDPKAAAQIAILDPTLTVSQPRHVTVSTGIDAIAHAVESAVTLKRNAISLMFSREAFRLLFGAFEQVLRQPMDLDARGRMLLGAAFAGAAIENSMLGAAHSAANPLTAHYGVVHGQAVAIMLPHVMEFNAADPGALLTYSELAALAGLNQSGGSAKTVQRLTASISKMLAAGGISPALSDCGVKKSKIASLAEEAAAQWTAKFNPRAVRKQDFVQLYNRAY